MAFDAIARHYRPMLLTMTFMRIGDNEEAEDLVQEILAQAWRKLPSLQHPELFMVWLKTVAANACSSWYRRSKGWSLSLEVCEDTILSDTNMMPLEAILQKEKQRALWQALRAIPDANRTALLLHVWGEYSYEEIAVFTGVQANTVAGRIHRAKEQLRRLLRNRDLSELATLTLVKD